MKILLDTEGRCNVKIRNTIYVKQKEGNENEPSDFDTSLALIQMTFPLRYFCGRDNFCVSKRTGLAVSLSRELGTLVNILSFPLQTCRGIGNACKHLVNSSADL